MIYQDMPNGHILTKTGKQGASSMDWSRLILYVQPMNHRYSNNFNKVVQYGLFYSLFVCAASLFSNVTSAAKQHLYKIDKLL